MGSEMCIRDRSTGWSLAWSGQWLPVTLADRDACLVVIGMLLEPTREDTELIFGEMVRMFQHHTPPREDVTLARLVSRPGRST